MEPPPSRITGSAGNRVLDGYGSGRLRHARAVSTAAATLLQGNDRHASHNSGIHENTYLNPSIGVFGNLHGQSNQLLAIRFGVIEEINALRLLGCCYHHRIYRCLNNASVPPPAERIAVGRQPNQRIQLPADADEGARVPLLLGHTRSLHQLSDTTGDQPGPSFSQREACRGAGANS